jgi:hypothetical protein
MEGCWAVDWLATVGIHVNAKANKESLYSFIEEREEHGGSKERDNANYDKWTFWIFDLLKVPSGLHKEVECEQVGHDDAYLANEDKHFSNRVGKDKLETVLQVE